MAPDDTAEIPPLKVFGCGNPLLDIVVEVKDQRLNDKYNIPHGGYTFETVAQQGLYEELSASQNRRLAPGGSTLNSLRICQALMRGNGLVSFTGCVGDDEYGRLIHDMTVAENIEVDLAVSKKTPTGVCGVIVVGVERSMCTRLGASSDFPAEHLTEKCKRLIIDADVIYSAGFFVTMHLDAVLQVAESCRERGALFITNLSAPSLPRDFKAAFDKVLPYTDILVGNLDEFDAFAVAHHWGVGMPASGIARRVVTLLKDGGPFPWGRVVVVTQGEDPTVVAISSHDRTAVFQVPVLSIAAGQVIDTTGAGDAFVGGFLYGLSKLAVHGCKFGELDSAAVATTAAKPTGAATTAALPQSLERLLYYAHYAAHHVIQRSAVTFDFKRHHPDDFPRAPSA